MSKLAGALLSLVSCTPTRIVVEPQPITIVVQPAPAPPRCDDVERVLVEDELSTLDAGPITTADEQ